MWRGRDKREAGTEEGWEWPCLWYLSPCHPAARISISTGSFITVRSYSERQCAASAVRRWAPRLSVWIYRDCVSINDGHFRCPQGHQKLSRAWQLVAEFAERWHGAWLGCSLDNCPNRRSASQVSNRKWAKDCTGGPYGPVRHNPPHMEVCPDI